MYFSYVFGGKKLFNCFLEKIVIFRGIIFNITPAIWLMSRFLNKWIWKTRYYYISCKPTKTKKTFHIWKCPVTKTKKDAGISNEFQLQNPSLSFNHKKRTSFSYRHSIFRSPMAYKTTASLYKLTCTDYMDFGKCQDQFALFSWSKKDSN